MVVSNIVATAKFDNVNHRELMLLHSCEPKLKRRKSTKKFNGAIIRLPGLCTCLVFPNGAVTALGIKDVDKLNELADEICLKMPGQNVCCTKQFHVCNIVLSKNFNVPIDLNQLYGQLRESHFLMFTPESFPGMKIKLFPNSKVVAIVFHTGKAVITGLKNLDAAECAENELQHLVDNYCASYAV